MNIKWVTAESEDGERPTALSMLKAEIEKLNQESEERIKAELNKLGFVVDEHENGEVIASRDHEKASIVVTASIDGLAYEIILSYQALYTGNYIQLGTRLIFSSFRASVKLFSFLNFRVVEFFQLI